MSCVALNLLFSDPSYGMIFPKVLQNMQGGSQYAGVGSKN